MPRHERRIRWISGDDVVIRTVQELDEILDGLDEEQDADGRIIVVIDGPAGESVYLGVGGSQSFISSLKHPYLTSLGDKDAEGSEDYFFQGHHSPIERHHLIPKQVARVLIRDFFRDGTLHGTIPWEPA